MRNSGKPEPPEFLTPGSRGSEAVISDTGVLQRELRLCWHKLFLARPTQTHQHQPKTRSCAAVTDCRQGVAGSRSRRHFFRTGAAYRRGFSLPWLCIAILGCAAPPRPVSLGVTDLVAVAPARSRLTPLPMLVFSHIDSRYLTKGESKYV